MLHSSKTAFEFPSLLVKHDLNIDWQSYWSLARLHKFPMGAELIFWPAVWGLLMAAPHSSLDRTSIAIRILIYAFGGTLLHSTGCVFNDMCDRHLDRLVERTKNRPLASGALSMQGASIFLAGLMFIYFGLLTLGNKYVAMLGFVNLMPLTIIYPFMKRITYWPQAWLGIAMNWSYMIGWADVAPNAMDLKTILIAMFGMMCWTLVYDTIYGCQDREDDIKAGILSTAVFFGSRVKSALAVFAATFLTCFAIVGYMNSQGPLFYIVSLGGAAAHLGWQLATLDPRDEKSCWQRFMSNGQIGPIIAAGLILDLSMH